MEQITINLDGLDVTQATTAAVGGVFGFLLVAGVALAILFIIAGWKIFEKAGEKGWKILIPVYNAYILFKICGLKKWFWAMLGVSIFASILMTINPPLLQGTDVNFFGTTIRATTTTYDITWSEHIPYLIGMIISLGAGIAVAIAIAVRLAKAFGKSAAFTLGLIFLSGIFYLILGFGKAKYDKKAVNA